MIYIQVSQLLSVKKASDLNNLFKCDPYYFYFTITNKNYREFKLPKKKGGFRLINSPDKKLKKLQITLSKALHKAYAIQRIKNVHGFIRHYNLWEKNVSVGHVPEKSDEFSSWIYYKTNSTQSVSVPKNSITNAGMHTGKKFLLNLDIENFFESITSKMVLDLFKARPFHYSEQLAAALTLLCTYKGKLPQGAPTSPVLSNWILLEADKKITEFCNMFNITYSRYADDLSFSTNEPEFENTATTHFKAEIENILFAYGFKLNEKKIIFRTHKQSMKVTGITVNQKTNVSRNYIREIRAMMHDWDKNGLTVAAQKHFKKVAAEERLNLKFIAKLRGKMEFLGMVRKKDELYLKYKRHFDCLNTRN